VRKYFGKEGIVTRYQRIKRQTEIISSNIIIFKNRGNKNFMIRIILKIKTETIDKFNQGLGFLYING
jgi:hypothetical protein